jgi:hypothetical protein
MVRWQHFLDKNSQPSLIGILVKKVLPPHHPVGGSVAPTLAVNTPSNNGSPCMLEKEKSVTQ